VLTTGGFVVLAGALALIALVIEPDTSVPVLLVLLFLVGTGSAFLWGPLGASANRNLPPHRAGAGSGVYNAMRQVGAVLGSAAIAVLMDSRLAAQGLTFAPGTGGAAGGLPRAAYGPFTQAMSESLLVLPAVLALGLLAVLFLELPRHLAAARA
jgi:MFS family permease